MLLQTSDSPKRKVLKGRKGREYVTKVELKHDESSQLINTEIKDIPIRISLKQQSGEATAVGLFLPRRLEGTWNQHFAKPTATVKTTPITNKEHLKDTTRYHFFNVDQVAANEYFEYASTNLVKPQRFSHIDSNGCRFVCVLQPFLAVVHTNSLHKQGDSNSQQRLFRIIREVLVPDGTYDISVDQAKVFFEQYAMHDKLKQHLAQVVSDAYLSYRLGVALMFNAKVLDYNLGVLHPSKTAPISPALIDRKGSLLQVVNFDVKLSLHISLLVLVPIVVVC